MAELNARRQSEAAALIEREEAMHRASVQKRDFENIVKASDDYQRGKVLLPSEIEGFQHAKKARLPGTGIWKAGIGTPDVEDLHSDQLVQDVEIVEDPQMYFGDQIYTQRNVMKRSDKISVLDSARLRVDMTDEAEIEDGQSAQRVEIGSRDIPYELTEFKLAAELTRKKIAEADAPLDLELNASQQLTDLIRLIREISIAKSAQDATNYTRKNTTANSLSSVGSTTELQKTIRTAVLETARQCGVRPNLLVANPSTLLTLLEQAGFIDGVKYTVPNFGGAFERQLELFAEFCMVDEVVSFESSYNTAKFVQDDTNTPLNAEWIWNTSMVSLLVRSEAVMRGTTFGMNLSRGPNFSIERFEIPDRGVFVLQVASEHTNLIASKNAAFTFTDAV